MRVGGKGGDGMERPVSLLRHALKGRVSKRASYSLEPRGFPRPLALEVFIGKLSGSVADAVAKVGNWKIAGYSSWWGTIKLLDGEHYFSL